MPDWFIMVVVATKVMFVGPISGEENCHAMKHLMFADRAAVCVPKSLLDAKNHI